MNLKLHVWRQNGAKDKGHFETYEANDVLEDMSFLEMLDVVNERLESEGKEPIAFESDCREGICGACGCMINGQPHGHKDRTTTCQLHMREFSDGDEIVVEPFRAKAFPVIKDLVVDRSGFDRIIQSGGYVSVRTGSAPDGNAIPIPKEDADAACVLRLDVVDDVRGRATVECELGLEGARKLDDALREASARVEALARVSGEDARA